MTKSNPTQYSLHTPTSSKPLNTKSTTIYEPTPLKLNTTQKTITQYYINLKINITPNQIILTTSTNKSYSLLFKLLLNPNDTILLPKPSYPLFDFLTQLNTIQNIPYQTINYTSLKTKLTQKTHIILTIHPNNPTNQYIPQYFQNNLKTTLTKQKNTLIINKIFYDFT